jgi:transcription elongation factor GreA
MPKPLYLTADELERLDAELTHLKTAGRRQVRDTLVRSRAYGDFRENAEFDEAKRQQGMMEARILELENIVGVAQVIETTDTDRVAVGATVIACDLETSEEMTFCVRTAGPGDPTAITVTPDSPIGKCLMGKAVLDVAEATTPSGTRKYKIVSIAFPHLGATTPDSV